MYTNRDCTFSRENFKFSDCSVRLIENFAKKSLGVHLIESVLLIEKLPFFCVCSVQIQRNDKVFSIFNLKNNKMEEKRLQAVCFFDK